MGEKGMHPIKHFRTITKHRHLVMRNCFRVGLIRQGLLHDLSKYSAQEFWQGAKYWCGVRSPNAVAREDLGCSTAWMHHKGRNKHHYEYWTDLNTVTGQYEAVPMPRKYLVESVMDRIAACKTYHGKAYTDADPLAYLHRARETPLLHPDSRKELEYILHYLEKNGEQQTFRMIKTKVLSGKPMKDWN